MTTEANTAISHFYGLCERTDPTYFLGEPLNTLTNLGFVIAAIMLLKYMLSIREDLKGFWIWDIYLLVFMTFCIGIASFFFHTMPSPFTEMADMAFIVTFIVIYFTSALFRIAKCNWLQAFIGLVAYAGGTHMLVTAFPNAMNDSIGYLSSMTALIIFALHLNMKRRFSARKFLVASIIGVASLFFRSVDNYVCDMIPFGTHFLWHTLNAVLIFILVKQLIRNVNRRARMLRKAAEHFA